MYNKVKNKTHSNFALRASYMYKKNFKLDRNGQQRKRIKADYYFQLTEER
jgi:hypothetical protein